jgi:hypothetical protein
MVFFQAPFPALRGSRLLPTQAVALFLVQVVIVMVAAQLLLGLAAPQMLLR